MSESLPDQTSNLPAVTPTPPGKLVDLVLSGQSLGLSDEARAKLATLASLHVAMKPAALRQCSTDCPMHDVCPYITQVAQADRPYDKRCPIEAEIWETEFKNAVTYVQSMDPETREVPAVELGLCRDLAFEIVVQARLAFEISKEPTATITTPVPGSGGGVTKEENPAQAAYDRACMRVSRAKKELFSMVQARLKRTDIKQARREKAIDAIRRLYEEKKTALQDSPIQRFLDEASKEATENMEKARGTRGSGSQ